MQKYVLGFNISVIYIFFVEEKKPIGNIFDKIKSLFFLNKSMFFEISLEISCLAILKKKVNIVISLGEIIKFDNIMMIKSFPCGHLILKLFDVVVFVDIFILFELFNSLINFIFLNHFACENISLGTDCKIGFCKAADSKYFILNDILPINNFISGQGSILLTLQLHDNNN